MLDECSSNIFAYLRKCILEEYLMIVIKTWCHIRAFVQYLFYKLLYGSKLQIGKAVTWRRGFSIMKTPNAIIRIGHDVFFNNDCSIAANCCIDIGVGVLFGEGVKIYDHNHRFAEEGSIKNQGYSNGEIYIGEHCWIGSGVVILKGAVISEHCVIGAGCVISGYVPPWSIVKLTYQYKIEEIRKTNNL